MERTPKSRAWRRLTRKEGGAGLGRAESPGGGLVEFAAYLMNRCDIGSNGKTPLQRLHGRRVEFGEKILFMPAKPARGGKGTAIPSWSVRGDAELVVRSSGCHPAGDGDQHTLSEYQENPRVGEMGRGQNTWNTSVLWSPDGSDHAFDIQVGMERLAEMVRRDSGEVLMENKVARTYLRRADFEQWSERSPLARGDNKRTAKHSGRGSKAC